MHQNPIQNLYESIVILLLPIFHFRANSSFFAMRIGSPSSSSSRCSRFWSSALRSKRLVSPAEKAARDSSDLGLSRRLGVLDLVLLGIGASIGAGIFVVTGTVARDAGPGKSLFYLFIYLIKVSWRG